MFARFKDARDNFHYVRDDVQRCAYQIGRDIGYSGFQPSTGWIAKFKHAYRIERREITKFQNDADQQTFELACEFLNEVKQLIPQFNKKCILHC